MMDPKIEKQMHSLILETLNLEEKAGKLLLKIDENKDKLKKLFDSEGVSRVDVPAIDDTNGSVTVVCKKSERATIKYDAEKLRGRVDKEIFNEVTKRTYKIADIDKMISLIKGAGIRARDFKELLEVDISVDNQAIKRLYDAGEITMDQLNGAYTAKISKTIKITEEKSE